MDDLLLFSLLRDREHADERLPSLLVELCDLPARARVPYMAWMYDLAIDETLPLEIRAPAVRAMEGADGVLPLEAAIAALDSPDPKMMQAGLVVLRSAASRRPARMAHLLFHSRLEVRKATLEQGAAVPDLEFYLLADPDLREIVRSRGASRDAPKNAISAVLDFHERGFLSKDEARKLVTLHAAEIPGWAQSVRERRPDVVSAFLAAKDLKLLEGKIDDLDAVLDLFWEEPPPDFFATLARTVRGPNEARFACALLRALALHETWPKGAAGALLALHPEAIGWLGDKRRKAFEDLYAMGVNAPKRAPNEIEIAVKAIPLHEDGTPDLWSIGAVLQMHPAGEPHKNLIAWLGSEAIDSALSRRPAESASLLHAFDNKGQRQILEIVHRTVRLALLVRFAIDGPDAMLAFLHEIDGDTTGLLAPTTGRGWLELLSAAMTQTIPHERMERIADICASRMNAQSYEGVLKKWIDSPSLPGRALGFAVTVRAAQNLDADAWVALAKTSGRDLPLLLEAIASAAAFPWPKEKALALALADHADSFVRAWSAARTPVEVRPAQDVVAPVVTGVAKELSTATARTNDVDACVRLLGSNDPIEETLRELARFGSDDPGFRASLDRALVTAYAYRDVKLSPLGHAWLWRWDKHGAQFIDAWSALFDGLPKAIDAAFAIEPTWVRWEVQSAIANAFAFLAARDPGRLATMATESVVAKLTELLAGDGALRAANALAVLHKTAETRGVVDIATPRIRLMLPDLEEPVRAAIASWIDSEGLPAKRAPRAAEPELDTVTIERIRATTEVDELLRLASSQRIRIVHEATLRLLELGERGQVALLGLLAAAKPHDVEVRRPIVESVTLWAPGESVRWAGVLCSDKARPSELRFRLAIALLERGEDTKDALIDAVRSPSEERWFAAEDWEKAARYVPSDVLAVALASSPHPHAHMRAVEHLLAHDAIPNGKRALREFLATGTRRMGSLRRRAASQLFEKGDQDVFPLVLEQFIEDATKTILEKVPFRLVALAVRSIVMCAPNMAKEPAAQKHLGALSIHDEDVQDLWAWLAENATVDQVRSRAVAALGRSGMRARRVRAIAQAFAWGQDRSRELTGRVFRVQMTGGKGLGYTRFRENKVHVSPMPILRGDRFGVDVVRALVLHELGHHMYHRGAEREKVWAEAQKEGIHGLLNLVADEHLERNLRAIDPEYGDLLKRLAAYAFQHAEREIKLETLLGILQGRAFEVLTASHIGVARDPDSVKVDSGALLRTMERAELSFARFIRALRMGLGNRSEDPLVEQGLELFRERFRKNEMPNLLEISRQLRSLFGWQVKIVEHFGTHESLEEGEEDGSHWGISDDEIEREVERIREPKPREDREIDGKPGGRPWINVEPKTHFDKITQVKKMPFDAAAHAPYAKAVERNAGLLRKYLEELGLSLVPVRSRLVGNRIDTTRLRALVLRGDPRVLMARTKSIAADVFVGIVIDCSGSMASRGNMERAKHFAVLIAEAAATLRGVDVRVFGFTDRLIYDCGDARRCAAHTLAATGGNNDAAALWHAANVAKASRRRAKLLVMISDGLPTECSVEALRGLVELLTKREKMVCAQVAVQPLTEVCFPHYVVVQDADADVAVRKFGEILVRLVGRAIAA